MRYCHLILQVLLCAIVSIVALQPSCGPGTKTAANGTCIEITDHDVIRSIHWLASPPKANCNKIVTAQDIGVCVDNLPPKCVIWSTISSNWCDHYGMSTDKCLLFGLARVLS